jgi:Ca2+ transporting ATPase
MSVRKVAFFDQKDALLELDVTGNTYGPEGLVKHNSNILKNPVAQFPALEELSTICSTCNDSKITYNAANDSFNRIGEPTEAALYTLVEKLGSSDPKIQEKIISLPDADELEKLSFAQKEEISSVVNDCFAEKYKRLNLLEFSRDRKSMSVIVSAKEFTARNSKSITYLHCKGAPESVLDRCSSVLIGGNVVSLTNSLRKKIQDKFLGWAGQKALRVLGFARVVNPQVPSKLESSDFLKIESEMTFVGLVGMLDPPRPEVKDAIQKCRTAGIRVVVITGDNKKTAESICRQIGIFSSNEDLKNRSFTGHEFDAMTPQQKLDACLNADLFSRTEPSHKSELVDILKSKGYIVAMVLLE